MHKFSLAANKQNEKSDFAYIFGSIQQYSKCTCTVQAALNPDLYSNDPAKIYECNVKTNQPTHPEWNGEFVRLQCHCKHIEINMHIKLFVPLNSPSYCDKFEPIHWIRVSVRCSMCKCKRYSDGYVIVTGNVTLIKFRRCNKKQKLTKHSTLTHNSSIVTMPMTFSNLWKKHSPRESTTSNDIYFYEDNLE